MSCRRSHARVPPPLARIAAHALVPAIACACSVFDESRLGARAPDEPRDGAVPTGGSGGTAGAPQAGRSGGAGGSGPSQGGRDGGEPQGGASGTLADGGDAQVTPPPCEPPAVDDYCMHVPALEAEPVIDGELDCGARLLDLPPVGWNGEQPMPEGHRTQLAAGIRPDGLYVYVEVHGGAPPMPHPAGSYIDCGDAVEIYVDADGVIDELGKYSTPGTMQFIIAAPSPAAPATIEALRFIGGENQGAWSSPYVHTRLLEDGYAVEVLIRAADLELTAWAPAARIGFDVAIDVAASAETPKLRCGLQLGQYFLRMGADDEGDAGICHGKPWCDTRAFCTPEL